MPLHVGRARTISDLLPSVHHPGLSPQTNPAPRSSSRPCLPTHRNSAKAEARPLSPIRTYAVASTLVSPAHFPGRLEFFCFRCKGMGPLSGTRFQPGLHHVAAVWHLENDLPISTGGVILVPSALLPYKTDFHPLSTSGISLQGFHPIVNFILY